MGCTSSTVDKSEFIDKTIDDLPEIFSFDCHLFPEDVCSFAESITYKSGSKKLYWSGNNISFDYVTMTKTGIDPDKPNRCSQDYYSLLDFRDSNSEEKRDTTFVLGVFDGHGSSGDRCSKFVARNLTTMLSSSSIKDQNLGDLIGKNLTDINKLLHADRYIPKKDPIDDYASGTTAVVVGIYKDNLYCCNIGDSRCIVGLQNKDQIVAHPFSEDHNPYLCEEKARIMETGGVVQTQSERLGISPVPPAFSPITIIHKEADPPRVWKPDSNFPGTAFSRSLGDFCAEELGVIGEPNIYYQKMNSNIKYIILASDGVWEFLSNQNVIDILEKYSNRPLVNAVVAVLLEAYKVWMKEEKSSDDITIQVIRIYSNTLTCNDDNRWKSLEDAKIH